MTELQKSETKLQTIRQLLVDNKNAFRQSLPAHITVERLLRVAFNSIQANPILLDCTKESLLGALLQCATLGVEPDGVTGQAYLVPFKVKGVYTVVLIVGYKGLMDLARRTGEIATIEARVVRERDLFKFQYGIEQGLVHTPTFDEPGNPVAYYCFVRYKDKSVQFEVMSQKDIDKVRATSKAKDDGPWKTHPEEMGMKTVVRKTCKYLPFSVNLHTAIGLDERAEIGISQELEALSEPLMKKEEQKAKLDQLKETLQKPEPPGFILPAEGHAEQEKPREVVQHASPPPLGSPRLAEKGNAELPLDKPKEPGIAQAALASQPKFDKVADIMIEHGINMNLIPNTITEGEAMVLISHAKSKTRVLETLEKMKDARARMKPPPENTPF